MSEEPKQDTEDTDTDTDTGAEEEAAARAEEDDGAPLDLASRRLCPDGACIGVIGPDGRCKVCGTPYGGRPADADAADADAADADDDADADADVDDDADAPGGDEADEDAAPPPRVDDGELDIASRKLCSDGECIGVIGPDGRCKECGKPYTGDPRLD